MWVSVGALSYRQKGGGGQMWDGGGGWWTVTGKYDIMGWDFAGEGNQEVEYDLRCKQME